MIKLLYTQGMEGIIVSASVGVNLLNIAHELAPLCVFIG